SLAGDADDSDTPPENLEFAKVDGPDWLTVASSGDFSGTPGQDDIGLNIWTVSVSDGAGVDQAQLEITVFQPPGLVHHWPFLETSGTTAVDVVGGFDGNLLNFDDPPGTDSGWTGNGLQFDGDNDRIVGIEGAVSPAGYTISAWVTPDSFGGENWIIVQRDGSGDRSQWGFRQNGRINGGKNDFEGLGTTNLEIGAEQFVAFTYDGLDTIRGYLNGEEEYSRGGNSYSPGFDSIPNTIGAFPDDNFNFDGLIRDLRIYDTALPQPEIQALFAAGPTGSEPPAVVITDLSHNSDSGEIRISWESNEGLLYNLRGETDPSAAEPLDWPI
ncbi:MAG: LamG domain-containing protein, partial [Akkermansiaceae bacterium]|nr:LamG domain-containing protein [Akkermansiaceae bacterium]